MNWSSFLPPVAEEYQGPKASFYFLIFVAIVSTVRSLIHILAPDGGASSIAGIAVDVAGGRDIWTMGRKPAYPRPVLLASYLTVSVSGSVYAGDRVYRASAADWRWSAEAGGSRRSASWSNR